MSTEGLSRLFRRWRVTYESDPEVWVGLPGGSDLAALAPRLTERGGGWTVRADPGGDPHDLLVEWPGGQRVRILIV